MAHWFHRNPLKATAKQDFQLKMVAHDVEAIKIVSDLKQARARLLELLPDPHHGADQVDTALRLYMSVLKGFLEVPASKDGGGGEADEDPDASLGPQRASKLRNGLRFRWSDSMLGNTPQNMHDAAFEVASVLMNVAFWHMKHAGMVAAKEDLKVEEAKDIHTSLRKSAGLMKFVQDSMIPQMVERARDGSDLDIRVIAAYLNQCTAEAQEVTIARAISLKHNPSLISALANETAKMYLTAADSLSTLDQKVFGHWRVYLILKSKFYLAYAYNYMGENLLAQDKCGEAIRALQEAKKNYGLANDHAREYAKTKGPGTQAKPERHAFFRKLGPIVQRTLDKCERENGMIYHQKVAYDPPDLEIKDKTFGLVAPEDYSLPPTSPLWTAVAYAAFDISQNPLNKKDKKKQPAAEKAEGDLKPVKEVEVKQSDKDPDHESGCVVS